MNQTTMPPLANQAQAAAQIDPTCYDSDNAEKCQAIVSFTLYTKDGGNLTKTISLDDSGKVVKDASACWMANGAAETMTMPFSELPEFFGGLSKSQAVGWGIAGQAKAAIVSRSQMKSGDAAITRTQENFAYPQGEPGVVLLDCDSDKKIDEILPVLAGVVPGFEEASRIIKPSVSAGLFSKSTGKALPGHNNAHIYLLVKNASDIPRFGKALHERLILAGHGRVEFARDGKILIRTLIDQFVHRPERLDFVAPPLLIGDLEQKQPEIQYLQGAVLDTGALQDLSAVEKIQYEQTLRVLRGGATEESKQIRDEYMRVEGKKLADKQKIPLEEARQHLRNRVGGVLSGDDCVLFDNGSSVPAREILKDSEKYHGLTMPDPVDPAYGGGTNKAIFYANTDTGVPIIHSFAHGERIFYLCHDFQDLRVLIEGGATQKHCLKMLAHALLDDDECEELLELVQKKKGGKIRKLRERLQDEMRHIPKDFDLYETPEYAALNLKYGVVMAGSNAVIIEEKLDIGLKAWGFNAYKPRELMQYMEHVRVPTGKGADNIFKLWMQYDQRNTFDGLEFQPDPNIFRTGKRIIQQGGIYNLWQGYTTAPMQGDCSLILEHIRDIWCGGDAVMNEYVLNWLADMFQHPNRQGKTALVLRSGQGTGKNIIADGVIGRLLGSHALTATRKNDFLGRFNSQLGQSVFIFVNEAIWAGDRESQGALKALITDDFLTIERKYLDTFKTPNFSHLLFASNEGWVAPTDIGDRRFVYPDVSDAKRGDSVYFKKLGEQINDAGRSAFLYEMLRRDLADVDLTRLPTNQSAQRLTDQLQTAPNHIKFLVDILSEPDFDPYKDSFTVGNKIKGWDFSGWDIQTEDFYKMYLTFCQRNRILHPATKNVLIRNFHSDVPGLVKFVKLKQKAGRVRALRFPRLDKAREIFTQSTKLEISWEI